jgi:CRP-like cAMP-binding protein
MPSPDLRVVRTAHELFFAALARNATGLEPWVTERLTSELEDQDVEAGKRIYAAGEEVDFIYYMREGRIRVLREGASSWTFEGRWALGGFDAALDRPHTRTAVALTNLHLMKVRADLWFELLEDSFELARAVVSNSARSTAALEAKAWASESKPKAEAIVTVPPGDRPLTFLDRLALLTEVAQVRGAGVQVLANLAGLMEDVTFEAGEPIFPSAKGTGRSLIVIDGEVLGVHADSGLTVSFGPGTSVCGAAPLGESEQSWRAHALTRTRTLSLAVEDWLDLMEEHFDLVRSAVAGLALARERCLDTLAAKTGDVVLR